MEYVPVRVSTLRGDLSIQFDLHILLRERYVLYIRRGDNFEGDRLQKLKQKKLRKMYILPEDEVNYRSYIEESLNVAYDPNSDASIENRAQVVQGHQQANAEEVMDNPGDKAAYDNCKEGVEKYVDFLMNNDQALQSVLDIENSDKDVAHHGVTVATLAVGMAKKLNIIDSEQQKLLTMGCILHDMGHLQHPVEFRKSMEEITGEDLDTYKQHPRMGAEQAKDKQHFDPTVINIIMQHHETLDGNGYPQGLSEKNIDKLALVCGAANQYDRHVTFEGIEPKEAMKKVMIEQVGRYPLEYLNSLRAVLKEQNQI